MQLPDLPPDLAFPMMGMSEDDLDFAFEAKRAAMGPHIIGRWGWDEAFQRDLHRRRYQEKPFFEVRRAGQRLGTVSFQVLTDHVRFGEFYLFPAHQGQGTGSAILVHCLAVADRLRLPVRLEYLWWNPVASLYRRHGFAEIARSEIHCFMERPSSAP
jgi:GNAT superfamily N-acetyltransferase